MINSFHFEMFSGLRRVSVSRFFNSILIALVFQVALLMSPSLSLAGPEEDAYLREVGDQLNEKWEEVFYEFSDLVLKKYCPREYDLIQDILLRIYRTDRRVTLSDLRDDRDSILEEVLHRCPEARQVVSLEYRYNEHVAILTADLIIRIEGLLSNESVEMDFDSKRILADRIVEVTLEQEYQAPKILELILAESSESRSAGEVRSEFLAKQSASKNLEAAFTGVNEGEVHALPNLPSSHSAAGAGGGGSVSHQDNSAQGGGDKGVSTGRKEQKEPKEQKSRCAVCRKKLGLVPFDCRCGGQFCGTHRMPDDHECTFDFKSENQAQLSRLMPTVKGDKLPDKI